MIYLILIFAFLVRALPRLRLKHVLVSDTCFHLYCARLIRENGFVPPAVFDRIVMKNRYSYPYLYHLMLALFPEGARMWAERLTGAFFDTGSVAIGYVFSTWVIRYYHLAVSDDVPLLVAILFAFSPLLLRIGLGPRAYNGSPRVMGQMFYMLHIMTAYYGYATGNVPSILCSVVAGAAIVLSSKFGTQVLFFFSVFYALFINPLYLLLLIATALGAEILSRRGFLILAGQIKHSHYYFKYLQRVYLFPNMIKIGDYLRRFRTRIRSSLKGFAAWFYQEYYFPHVLLTTAPHFLLWFYFLARPETFSLLPLRFLFLWMTAGSVWGIATKFKLLRFLGEGERYFEYALYPSLFLTAIYLAPYWRGLFVAYILYCLLSAVAYQVIYSGTYREVDKGYVSDETLFSRFRELVPGVIQPIGSNHWQALYRTHCPVLTYGANMSEELIPYSEFKLVFGSFSLPSADYNTVWTHYKVEYILSDHASLQNYRTQILQRFDCF